MLVSQPFEDHLRIGALARRLGLTARTLRYWEKRRLIPPARRSGGGFRLYGPIHLRAARGVVRLKEAGLGLDEIRALQETFGASPTTLGGMTELSRSLEARERILRERIRQAEALLTELADLRRCVSHCDGCNGKPFDGECISCLESASERDLPDALHGVLQTTLRSA